MKTEDVEIEWEGKKEIVSIKKFTWGERNKVIQDTIGKVKVLAGEFPQIEIDPIKWKESLLLHAIVKAPFKVDLETLRGLDPELAEKLVKKAEELNPFRDIL